MPYQLTINFESQTSYKVNNHNQIFSLPIFHPKVPMSINLSPSS